MHVGKMSTSDSKARHGQYRQMGALTPRQTLHNRWKRQRATSNSASCICQTSNAALLCDSTDSQHQLQQQEQEQQQHQEELEEE